MGRVYKDNNTFYFAYWNDNSYFYKKEKGKKEEKLEEIWFTKMNRIDNFIVGVIYYDNEGHFDLAAFDIEKEKFNILKEGVFLIQYYNDKIYCNNGEKICILNVEGTQINAFELKHPVYDFFLTEDTIYYVTMDDNDDKEEYKLYSCNLKGNDLKFIAKIESDANAGERIKVYDNSVYYLNYKDDYKIYRLNLETKQKTKITDIASGNFNILNNCIYFSNLADDKLYKINVNGNEFMKVSDDRGGDFYIIDNTVYYTDADESTNLDIKYIKEDGSIHTIE